MEQTMRREEQLPYSLYMGLVWSDQAPSRLNQNSFCITKASCISSCGIMRRTFSQVSRSFPLGVWTRYQRTRPCWLLVVATLKEYFFVATRDAALLDKALAQLSFGCRIAGSRERAYAPMPDDAQDWYRSVLDDDGVVRNSVARIEDGVLHIEQGPLVGQEARVKKIDRHKRWCLVDVGEGDSAFRELLPLDVPSKT